MLGFEISDFGNHYVAISAKPTNLVETDAKELIEKLLESLKENRTALLGSKSQVLAASMVKKMSILNTKSTTFFIKQQQFHQHLLLR